MKARTKQIAYFFVTAVIFTISRHVMAAANQSLTIKGYTSVAGGKKIPALLHISRSDDKADRVKQPDYRCCSFGVLDMGFEFPVDPPTQNHSNTSGIENRGHALSKEFHFSDFEGPDPLTKSRKLLTISNEGGTKSKKIKARTNSWMISSEPFGVLPEGSFVWHFALLQQKEALVFLRRFVQYQSKNISIAITDSQNKAVQLQADFVPTATEIEQIKKIMHLGLPKN